STSRYRPAHPTTGARWTSRPTKKSLSARRRWTIWTSRIRRQKTSRAGSFPPTVAPRSKPPELVQPLDEHRHSLAAADAHRLEPDRAVGLVEVVQERAHDPRAGHAVRVTERD